MSWKARYIRITFGTDLVPAEEIKCDVKEIKQELVAQKDRMWGLYVKIIIITCMSGAGGAGLLKLVL